MEKLTRRGKIRVVSFLSAVVIVLGIFGISQTVTANRYKREAELSRQLALISLDENLSNITVNLEKAAYANSPSMLSRLSGELWREASGAKSSLGMLPSSESLFSGTYKFLSQVGEYVMALQRKSASGAELTAEERSQLLSLYDYSKSLGESVSEMCFNLENGNLSFEKQKSTLAPRDTGEFQLSDGFDDAEQALSDFPSLIYDGPFSDHIENAEPKLLVGKREISQKDAQEIAGKICGDEELKFAYEENGAVSAYIFQSAHCTVGITKIGGYPLYMLNSQFAGESLTEYTDAVAKAKEFLEKIGYGDMKESYYYTNDGICTVNLAYFKDGIIYYPDLIKVGINLESGEVCSFDATGYISNHTERKLNDSPVTAELARERVAEGLEILGVQKCVIPTEWKSERRCFEFHCKSENERELLVYIDRETGEEADILILLYSDGGVLTK